MAHTLTEFPPKFIGEKNVFSQLTKFEDDDLYLWFGLDFIPAVSDIDLLIWHKKKGVFVVEIKAISLDMLLNFGFSSCEIKGRGQQKSPQLQAYDGLISLKNYVSPMLSVRPPFMVATVCWPLITRKEWNDSFSHNLEILNLSQSMLMKDDINSGTYVFANKLEKIWIKPPIRRGLGSGFNHENLAFQEFSATLSKTAEPLPSLSDFKKLENLEKGIRRDLMRSFSPSVQRRAIFKGKPGTGKTFRLLQIAILHATEGLNVLFCCFNKVLAAEIARFVNIIDAEFKKNNNGINLKEKIDIFDVGTIASRTVTSFGWKLNASDFDEWGKLIVDELRCDRYATQIAKYQTILLDEAQDFKGWHLDLISQYSEKRGNVIIGLGAGQELYKESKGEENFEFFFGKEVFQSITLRRNFRNTKPIFQLAHLAYECQFDESKINEIFRKAFVRNKSDLLELEFEISKGAIPELKFIDETIDEDFLSPNYKVQITENLSKEIERIIDETLDSIIKISNPIDLLILVPETTGEEVEAVRRALNRIEKNRGISYLDYVENDNRSNIPSSSKIRLVTYHSCRGLEAVHAIVIGAEKLNNMSAYNGMVNKLAYVVFSRAILGLTLCIRSNFQNKYTKFIEKAIFTITDNLDDTIKHA
jgi:hypothetical protein